jgi:hypothetical protein
MLLDAFAEPRSDRVWALRAEKVLSAVDAGRRPDELRRFLQTRATRELPVAVTAFLDDVTARAGRLRDLGMARIVEFSDAATAALIARDRRVAGLCRPLGERHVAVPVEHETQFRKAVQALGHVLPPAQ